MENLSKIFATFRTDRCDPEKYNTSDCSDYGSENCKRTCEYSQKMLGRIEQINQKDIYQTNTQESRLKS